MIAKSIKYVGFASFDEISSLCQTVKQYLYDLESLTTDDPRHSQLMEAVMKHLRPHNDSEEQTDLPLLEREIGEAESRAAAQRFEHTKKFVPTQYVKSSSY